MFASIKSFLYRHRKKFYIGGSVVTGLLLMSKYAEYKMLQWHDKQTQLMIERQKRRQHYEKTRQAANATALNLSRCLTKVVSDELETDELRQAIRRNPSEKLKLWETLKIQGFSRCIAAIYSATLVGCIIHAKLMVLGGYTYSDHIKIGKKVIKITASDQEKFLSHIQNFVENGLPLIFTKIRKATSYCIRNLPLNQMISLEQLEGILKDISLILSGEMNPPNEPENLKLQPLSRFITELNISDTQSPENIGYFRMTDEVLDVIDSEDFNVIFLNLVQHGISHVIDYVADFYPQPKIEKPKENNLESDLDTPSVKDTVVEITKKQSAIPNVYTSLVKATLPVAKLTPILSELIHPVLSPAPGQLLQFVLLNEQLENLCFNIYEAFSVNN